MMPSDLERFWSKVSKSEGCWEWTGGHNGVGHGRFWSDGALTGAHRFSWSLHRGVIPAGLQVLHRCDNPPCVNPDHLFLGTHRDNMQDSARKLRTGMAKLTPEFVQLIRLCCGSGMTQRYAARFFEVSQYAVWSIVNGRSWTHV